MSLKRTREDISSDEEDDDTLSSDTEKEKFFLDACKCSDGYTIERMDIDKLNPSIILRAFEISFLHSDWDTVKSLMKIYKFEPGYYLRVFNDCYDLEMAQWIWTYYSEFIPRERISKLFEELVFYRKDMTFIQWLWEIAKKHISLASRKKALIGAAKNDDIFLAEWLMSITKSKNHTKLLKTAIKHSNLNMVKWLMKNYAPMIDVETQCKVAIDKCPSSEIRLFFKNRPQPQPP